MCSYPSRLSLKSTHSLMGPVNLLQVSPNKQTGGKKKKREGEKEGERDLWTTSSENETGQDLDRRLSFMLAEEPIKL